ncbi:MAG: S-layer homology domain-containing protein [Clostridia bacterium]|nr:S-layer homology domain-containing protein [Clostridia bacterium]
MDYLENTIEANLGIPEVIINGEEKITLPLEYNDAKLTWTSSDSSVIDVNAMDENGVVAVNHGDSESSVTLSASLTYNGEKGYEVEGISISSASAHDFNITVEAGGEMTDEMKAKRALSALTIEQTQVKESFTLPLESVYTNNDTTITGSVSWASNNDAIKIDGENAVVTRPAYNKSNANVTLTASVTVGTATLTKDFTVTVLKTDQPETDAEKITYAESQLLGLNFSDDGTKVTSASITLPTEITFGDNKIADIVWESSDTEWMGHDGTMYQQPSSGTHTIIMKATITAGGVTEVHEYKVALRAPASVKAFPGAQGYGTQTRGGAGGYIVHVTSLGAQGPGTLYEALEQKKGARTIVFDVGGTIDLTPLGRALKMSGEDDSNVTIAGQTAPGEGIQLKGYGLTLSSVHDVIVRHLSIRIGNVRKAGDTYQSDPLSANGANKRVVLDHLSLCWAVDMGFRVYGEEVTMSNCMSSKGLYWNTPHEKGAHNYAGMFGAKYGSFYGNYMADCGQRSPRIVDNEYVDVRNNVVFNSKYTFDICNYEWMGANTKYNVVNNMVLKGSAAPAGSTGNVSKNGSYKYFQGRTYSGGVFAYSVNNYDNTNLARPLNSSDKNVTGALWTGDVSADETKQIQKELYAFNPGGYSNIPSTWYDMLLPSDISMEEYDASAVSKKGNTLVNYPFVVPAMKTYDAEEAAKYVLSNAGAKAPVRGILDNRYLAEGRTRLQILSDFSKASKTYGIKLDADYAGETAYGLDVETHTIYEDADGIVFYDVDGNDIADTSGLTIVEQYKFVSCDNHLDTLYAIDKDEKNKYRLELREYTDEDGIYDAFELYDIDNNKLEKPETYVSDKDSSNTDGMHYPNDIVLKYADWGDGAGNYNHADSSSGDGNLGTEIVDTEWSEYDWPQLPTVYRDGDFDTNGDGIPNEFIKLMGWDKHPEYSSTKDISRLDFEGRGYTNLEYYINDYCAGDMEIADSEENEPVEAENVRDGSSKYDTHRSHEILFNTVRRAKAKVYYCEGEIFDMDSAKEIKLQTSYDYEGDSNYTNPKDFDTYFSAIISDLKPETTYSYKIKTYSDSGIESISAETYTFTTKASSTGKPGRPRIIKYTPFDQQITIDFEPASKSKTYKQDSFEYNSGTRYLTTIGNNEYDTNTDHYILRYSTNADMSDAKEAILDSTLTKYVLTGLSNDNEYYLDLRAVSADGTESNPALYNLKKAEKLEGQTDKDGNDVYGVNSIEVKGSSIEEYYSDNDVEFQTVAIQPTLYVVNENYPESFKDPEVDIKEGETTKFITVYGDVKDWYIYTLGGIPIPTSYEGGDPMLMLRDDSHDHGFTYAKKFSTLLDGKSTIHAKLMIHGEELDPMNQAPELRFYVQQDSAASDDTDSDVDTTSENTASTFGNIITLQFTKNEVIFNGADSVFRYQNDVWYDIKLLMDAEAGTCSLYINDSLIGKDMEYSKAATSNSIARWQISSRLAGTEDVYIEYMYAYKGWDEPVTDPSATAKPDNTVQEGTSGARPTVGGGGSSGGGGGSEKPSATDAPQETDEPITETPEENIPDAGFIDMDNYEWAKEAVNTLHEKGIVYGITEDLFAPDREITRAEFITLLMRGFELIGEDASCNFEDVPDGSWYYPAVSMAYSMGIVSGYSDTYFGANDKVSRQDMAAMIIRLLDKLGLTLDNELTYEGFADDSEISDYARESVIRLYEAGIISGVGENRFDPKGTANRAASARILYATLKMQWDKQG